MLSKKICLFLVLTLVVQFSVGQNKTGRLAAIMKAYHNYNMFDGAVLVAENGTVIYKAAFGLANREWNIPNRTDTKFMLGSISKPLTATLTLIQVQKGLLNLDSSIDSYLPEFKNKPAAKATVRQLLSHTSGLQNYDIIKDFFPRISRQQFTREDYLKIFIDSPLAFNPGSRFLYSSWGYFTLGCIMERVTSKTYSELMRDDIFKKAGMNNSGSYYHTQVVKNRATGYDYQFGTFTSADFRDQSNTMGTGDIYSTVEDMFKFHTALSNNTLLNQELTALMFTPGMEPARYGFGWFNKQFKYSNTDSVASSFHLGMTEGFISFIRRIPSSNSMVVILCNSSPTDFFGISNNLLKALHNIPVNVKEPLHKKIETLIGSIGAEKAIVEYKKVKTDTAHFYTDWISMNFLAQQLYDLKRYDEARIVAELNAEEFPDRDLVMVTMGNIYSALGKKQDAIRFYKKALEINPGYEEAKNRLKALKE